jgi:O-antigen/teichoic acid export membrane protein
MSEVLSDAVVKRRAKSGALFVGSWGLVNLIVGFGGNLALARMLTPRDFGIIAVGATLMMLTTSLAEGGLGGGLIRREQPPDRAELRTALGLQLTLTMLLGAAVAGIASLLQGVGFVVAFMMIALPLAAIQTPGRVVLSRALRFRALSTVESIGNFSYYVWAITAAGLGMGVWALATGVLVKALVTTAGVIGVSRLGVVRPSYRGARAMRSVIAFGVRFQAVSLAGVGREQGLNAGVGIIGGVSTLGVFTLARRLLELPVLVFEPLHRVAFPVMSHVLGARQDPAPLIRRGVVISAAAGGFVLAGTAAAAPELVPGLFGEQWRAGGTIIPWICAGLAVAGPLSVVGVGYLYAVGEPSVVLRAILLHTATLYVVAFSLLPVVGPAAIGMGSFAGALVDALIMSRAIAARTPARPLRALLPLLAISAAAGLAGIAISQAVGTGLVAAVAGGLSGGAVYVALLGLFQTSVLRETARLLVQAVRSSLRRERPLRPAAEAA